MELKLEPEAIFINMKDTEFKLHSLDTVVWEKQYEHRLLEHSPYAYSRYRIYKRVEKHETSYRLTVETANWNEWNKSNINWNFYEGSLPFTTSLKAKFFLADYVTGYDISSNWIEKCQLSIHKVMVNKLYIGKITRFLLAILILIGIVIYMIVASKFIIGGFEAVGIDTNNDWFSVLVYPLSILIFLPVIWFFELRKKK